MNGLTSGEVLEKQKQFGKNEIKRTKKVNSWKIFLSQFTSPLVILLIMAALISFFIGYLPGQSSNLFDTSLILLIVLITGLSGFFQEYKAERSIEALQGYSIPKIQVFRDGAIREISVVDLVVGDVVLLEAGDIVPADAQILESFNLKIDESILTGESETVKREKGEEVFMGTSIHVGNAKALIVRIGMQTNIGQIANALQSIEERKTLFEEEIDGFSQKIFLVAGLITVVVFVFNFLKYDLYVSLLTAISLAVAAIPEGLPAVVVLALAVGANSMYKNKALIRKLNVVESIGAVDIICTDKTGTITKNEMTVVFLYLNNKVLGVDAVELDENEKKEAMELLACGVVCNNVKVEGHPEGVRKYFGEQTEIALMKIGERFGFLSDNLADKYKRLDELSFSSERKMMSVIVQDRAAGLQMYSKGAPEMLLSRCDRILIDGRIRKITEKDKENILAQNKIFASNALRVLGFSFKDLKKIDSPEDGLIWIGLQAMVDPPHPETAQVVRDCKTAGIRIIMITGDNAVTAKAIANIIGLDSAGVVEGPELEKMNDNDLEERINSGVNIFARTTPFHKLKILNILQKKYRVAMTGDGVNDSLALKKADVGIAMGVKGSAVAKESSDIILLNDIFATIVVAVREGRRIFDNIRKFINYLLVSNFVEISVIFFSTLLFTLHEPILFPVQILWINLLTDGLPALALGVDPAVPTVMQKKPRKRGESIINRQLALLIVAIGTVKTIILLVTFVLILPAGEDIARSALFTGFILHEFVRIASIRYSEKLGWLANPWLLGALSFSLLLQLIVLYTPLNSFFHVATLGVYEWMILISGTLLGYLLTIFITSAISKKN